MNVGTGSSYNLTTWQGHENLKVLSREIVKTDILECTLQDGPVDLLPAAFGLTSARTKGTVLGSSIDRKIMKLAYATVCKTMFTELCPDYSDQLHAALDLIKQVSIDTNGNSVSAPIPAYYMRLMNAARPFTSTGIPYQSMRQVYRRHGPAPSSRFPKELSQPHSRRCITC